MSRITTIPEPTKQRELAGLAEVCAETGLDQLPSGASELLAKELKFVVCLMRHGQQKRAAIEAGYSETSADQIASELLRKPRVAGFYRRCLEGLGATAKAALARLEERARIYHAKAVECAQEKEGLDKLMVVGAKTATNKGEAGSVAPEYLTRRENLARLEERYAKLALDADRALLQAAGKMGLELKVSGGLDHTITVTPEILPALTRLREDMLHARN